MAVGHDVRSSDSEVLNVAIIAPRDEACSRDCDRFELATNLLGSSFLDQFGQKIHQKIRHDQSLKIAEFAG